MDNVGIVVEDLTATIDSLATRSRGQSSTCSLTPTPTLRRMRAPCGTTFMAPSRACRSRPQLWRCVDGASISLQPHARGVYVNNLEDEGRTCARGVRRQLCASLTRRGL